MSTAQVAAANAAKPNRSNPDSKLGKHLPDFKNLSKVKVLAIVVGLLSIVMTVLLVLSGNAIMAGMPVVIAVVSVITLRMKPKTEKGTKTSRKTEASESPSAWEKADKRLLGLILAAFAAFILVASALNVLAAVSITIVLAIWPLLVWKKAHVTPWSYVRSHYKDIGKAFKVFFLKWSPLWFELEGTWREFFVGWLPFVHKSGLFIPVIGIPWKRNHSFRLSWMREELIDFVMIAYLLWSISDLLQDVGRVMLPDGSGSGYTLMFYIVAYLQVVGLLTGIVLLNKDGSRVRIAVYVGIAVVGLTSMLSTAQFFALEKGWINPDFFVLTGVNTTPLLVICVYALIHELVLQPLWNGLCARHLGTFRKITATMEMAAVGSGSSSKPAPASGKNEAVEMPAVKAFDWANWQKLYELVSVDWERHVNIFTRQGIWREGTSAKMLFEKSLIPDVLESKVTVAGLDEAKQLVGNFVNAFASKSYAGKSEDRTENYRNDRKTWLANYKLA